MRSCAPDVSPSQRHFHSWALTRPECPGLQASNRMRVPNSQCVQCAETEKLNTAGKLAFKSQIEMTPRAYEFQAEPSSMGWRTQIPMNTCPMTAGPASSSLCFGGGSPFCRSVQVASALQQPLPVRAKVDLKGDPLLKGNMVTEVCSYISPISGNHDYFQK